MARGIFVLPVVVVQGERVPKHLYVEDPGGGGPLLRDEVTRWDGSEPFTKAGTEHMAISVETTTRAAYDGLAGQGDTAEIDPGALATALNQAPPFRDDLTAKEWALVLSRQLALATY